MLAGIERKKVARPAVMALVSTIAPVVGAYWLTGLVVPDWLAGFVAVCLLCWVQPVAAFTIEAILRLTRSEPSEEDSRHHQAYLGVLFQWAGMGFVVWLLNDLSWFEAGDPVTVLLSISAAILACWLVLNCAGRSILAMTPR